MRSYFRTPQRDRATYHFPGETRADDDVRVLHGDVLLDKLFLELALVFFGLVRDNRLGLGHRRDDDSAAGLYRV